jgi:raffinose/stachyose/melibiose transport system permease protein
VAPGPSPALKNSRWRRGVGEQVILHAGLIFWGLICLYPLVWVIQASLKTTPELFSDPFGLPSSLAWSNFRSAWTTAEMSSYFLNSVVVTILGTAVLLLVSSMCAFALARFDFRLRGAVWAYILFGFLIPTTLTLIALAQLTRTIGLYDSRLGLILVYTAGGIPFNTFFLRGYMETIPRELEEAAVVDGAGMWTVYSRVIMPLSLPALTTVAIFSTLYVWSEFIIAFMLTQSPNGRTLPVGVANIASTFGSNQATVAAALVISMAPALLAFLFFQRYLVEGLTAGALKG